MGRRKRWPLVVAGIFALLGVGFFLALPMYVRSRAIATAASYGVTLRIGSVSVTPFAVHFRDVGTSIAELPNASASVDHVGIDLSNLQPTALSISGGRLQLEGSLSDVRDAVDRWKAAHARAPSGGGSGGSSSVQSTQMGDLALSWASPFGAGSRIEATGIDATFDGLPGARDTYEVTAKSALVDVDAKRFGPWGTRIARAARVSSLQVNLAPSGKKQAIVRVGADGDDRLLDVDIQRAHLSELGIPSAALALGGQDPEGTAQIHGREGLRSAQGTFAATLFGARFGGVAAPADVKIAGELTGDPSRGLDLQKGTFAFGPFSGALTGTLLVERTGNVRADLGFKSQPIPCVDIVKASAKQSLGDLGAQLGALAQAAGLTNAVEGAASVSGTFLYDANAPSATRFTLVPTNTCAINFLPR